MTKNELKLIAAAAMLLDHIGVAFLPQLIVFRIIGRLAFPIFSYSIYEGCKYTHNRKRYILQMLALGLICAGGYYIYSGIILGNVLITFSLSIAILYSIFLLEDDLKNKSTAHTSLHMLWLTAALLGGLLVCLMVPVDYGFAGVLLPVWAELAAFAGERFAKSSLKIRKALPLLGMLFGLLLLTYTIWDIQKYQVFGLLALIPLALYNGREGTKKMKYFFYYFYPAHLIAIGGIAELISK